MCMKLRFLLNMAWKLSALSSLNFVYELTPRHLIILHCQFGHQTEDQAVNIIFS